MKNIKISKKLLIGFGSVIIMTIIIGFTGIYGLCTMANASVILYKDKSLPLASLAKSIENMQSMRAYARNCIIYNDDSGELKSIETDIKNSITAFESYFSEFTATITTKEGTELANEISDDFITFKNVLLEMVDYAKKGTPQNELLSIMGKSVTFVNNLSNNLNKMIDLRMGVMSNANDDNKSLQMFLMTIIISAIVITIITATTFGLYITKIISIPMGGLSNALNIMITEGSLSLPEDITKTLENTAIYKDEFGLSAKAFMMFIKRLSYLCDELEKIARGDLTSQYEVASDKDIIGISLKKVTESLNSMFHNFDEASAQVKSGSSQVSDSAQLLAQGAAEQASSVQELSASILEVSEQVKVNAKNADTANSFSIDSTSEVRRGNEQMSEMLKAMSVIKESSNEISKIIKVIDDIAFQTNILALNAAVEAARAGEAGKGFAVVADEVRNLASKSADAAKQTTQLIAGSISNVESGVRIAEETADSLNKIADTTAKITGLVQDIAQASNEQSLNITQINQGVEQISNVVQTNSATAEESAAAAEQMSNQSKMLSNLITKYKF